MAQCNEILANSRQQCTRAGYATIDSLAYCRLHFSFRVGADKAQFDKEHTVCNPDDQSNLDSLLGFFKGVHEVKPKKV